MEIALVVVNWHRLAFYVLRTWHYCPFLLGCKEHTFISLSKGNIYAYTDLYIQIWIYMNIGPDVVVCIYIYMYIYVYHINVCAYIRILAWVCRTDGWDVDSCPWCVAVCCNVLQCVVCAQRLALVHSLWYCSVLQCVAGCCSVLQCIVVCCSVLQCVAVYCNVLQCAVLCCSVLYCVAVCCGLSKFGTSARLVVLVPAGQEEARECTSATES